MVSSASPRNRAQEPGRRSRLRLVAWLLCAGLGVFLGFLLARSLWHRYQDRQPLATNVVVIMVDTLRADHLSLYGYDRQTTPHLARRAARSGIVFENARSQAPCTFPSVNSALTSRSPLVFVRALGDSNFSIPPSVPTLASLLAAHGYSTAAVSASPIVRATPSAENPHAGFGAGFATFDETCEWLDAACVTTRGLEAMKTLKEPFLLYLHYLDPHDPYLVPGGASWFAGEAPSGPNNDSLVRGDPNPFAERLYREGKDAGLSKQEVEFLVDRYDDEIRYWDEKAEPFFAALERGGLMDRTAVVLMSDHGEEFLEHGHVKHCRSLFDSELRIPFLVFLPKTNPGRTATPVANLDLVPTVLDLLRVDPGAARFEGTSLRPLLTGRSETLEREEPAQRAWWAGERSVSDGRIKVILGADGRHRQLFDLERDPGETHNAAAADRRDLARLTRILARWTLREPDAHQERPDEVIRRLRVLGYLQ